MAAGPVLTAEGLVVARAGRVLVEGFDLELARGELVAVLGPNGVGKSSLLATLAGLLPPSGGTGPDGAVVAGDDAARVRAALAALPVEQQRAVVLARFSGLTAAEIGEREGIPLGTAKTRIRAGMLRLRDAVSGDVA